MAARSFKLLTGNCIDLLKGLGEESIDLVVTDIPYGISLGEWDVLHKNTNSSLGGTSPAQKKLGKGFKRRGKPINGWSKADLERPKEYQHWCETWARPIISKLKPGTSMFVFAGRRYCHRAVVALEDCGFLLRDLLSWERPTAHFKAQRLSKLLEKRGMSKQAVEWEGWRLGNLAPRFEPVIWMFKPYTIGGTIADNVLEHGVGAINTDACLQNGKQPCNIIKAGFESGEKGFHDAQKPISLMKLLIELTTKKGYTVLDPFCGSGSTGVACMNLEREFIGIDIDPMCIDMTKKRLEAAIVVAS